MRNGMKLLLSRLLPPYLIAHFRPHEVCDYMCGSNTTADAARTMGIVSHTYDLHSGFDLLHTDIKERPEFIFWHPPYWDIIKMCIRDRRYTG